MARMEYSDIAVTTTLVGGLTIGGLSLTLTSSTGYPAGTYQFVLKVEDELILCDSRSGTTVTINSSGRGFSGTTAIAHENGATVSHVWESHSATDLMRHVYATTHDDHPQYQRESEKNQNNGYAGLDSSGVVPAALIDSTLARDSEVTAAVASHTGATDPHGDRAYTDSQIIVANTVAGGQLATHEADTTAIHGIANTANLVLTGDARLADQRVPLDGSVTTPKLGDGVVTMAKVASEAWLSYTPTIGGAFTLGSGTVVGRYIKVGRTYNVRGRFTIGNGAKGSGLTIGGFPAAPVNLDVHGDVLLRESASGFYYDCKLHLNIGATSGAVHTAILLATPGGVYFQPITTTSPISAGINAGDSFEWQLVYEAAT